MAHQGKLLEQGAVTLLVAANTMAGTRVHRDRVDPLKKGAIPAIAVYMPDEETDLDASSETAPRELTRGGDLELQAFVIGSDAEVISDLLWDFQEQIENAFDGDPYINGAAADSILKRSSREIGNVDGKSDPLVGVLTMVFAVSFRTTQGATATDDFITAHTTHKITGGVGDTAPVVDEFTVQETP